MVKSKMPLLCQQSVFLLREGTDNVTGVAHFFFFFSATVGVYSRNPNRMELFSFENLQNTYVDLKRPLEHQESSQESDVVSSFTQTF